MLRDNYNNLISQLNSTLPNCQSGVKPANLLCLSDSEEYLNADIKVMIFGQEPNRWEGNFPHQGGVEHLQKTYEEFYVQGECFSYGRPFWNGVSKLQKKFRAEFSKDDKSVGFIWNDIVKIGKSDGKGLPPEELFLWQEPAFNIISKEVAHYKPDIVVFFTGPDYDEFIEKAFDDASFEPVEDRIIREFVRVKSRHLPEKSIRTYNTGYLRRSGLLDKYLDEIAIVATRPMNF